MAYPVVDEAKCVGCEECVDICPCDVFEMKNEKCVVERSEDCEECESCVETCEEGAIEMVEG
ncbi:4Fe-4S binding protein [Desulfococcaceae bacterium HSG8]|nr:4Fe-4S binding protein [Desulfococcaceae bacterium HSG8]